MLPCFVVSFSEERAGEKKGIQNEAKSDRLQERIMRLKGKVNWKSLVITLSAIAVFVTTYLLILPAITLDQDEAIQQGGIDIAIEQEECGDIVFRIPGEYIYEIREVDTGKKGYKYDPTVYRLVYNLKVEESEPGVYQLVMDRKNFRNGKEVDVAEYSFINEYKVPPSGGSNPLTGDNTNILLPAAAFAAALIALIVLFLKKRRNGKDDDK